MLHTRLRRPCAIEIAVGSNIGQSGPGSTGHQAIGRLARLHSSCDGSHLGKHDDNGAGFGQAYTEMRIQIIDRPRYIHTGPVLSDRPISAKKPSAVNVLEMFEKILIRDPKYLEDNEPDVQSNQRNNERRHCRTGG